MRFFFDRNTPISIAHMVAAISTPKHAVLHLDDDPRFEKTTPDTEWMKALKADGSPPWVIVSGDGRILKNKVERQVLDEVGLTYFCLTEGWTNTPIREYSWRFMKVWHDILDKAIEPRGRIFEVRSGRSLKIEKIA